MGVTSHLSSFVEMKIMSTIKNFFSSLSKEKKIEVKYNEEVFSLIDGKYMDLVSKHLKMIAKIVIEGSDYNKIKETISKLTEVEDALLDYDNTDTMEITKGKLKDYWDIWRTFRKNLEHLDAEENPAYEDEPPKANFQSLYTRYVKDKEALVLKIGKDLEGFEARLDNA